VTIQKDVTPDEIVHFNDAYNDGGLFRNEFEIAPRTGQSEVSTDNIDFDFGDPDEYINADPEDMSIETLRQWRLNIQMLGSADRNSSTDFEQMINEGVSEESLDVMRNILGQIEQSDTLGTPSDINWSRGTGLIPGAGDDSE